MKGPLLIHGRNYRVKFKGPGERASRVVVMTFLGGNSERVDFSLRPLGGTQSLDVSWIQSIEETTDSVSLPRRETR